MLAIIGGAGLCDLPGLQLIDTLSSPTPFGMPSGDIVRGRLHDHEILFLARHGAGHRLLEGHGVKGQDHLYKDRGAALARDGYAPLLAHLPAPPSK